MWGAGFSRRTRCYLMNPTSPRRFGRVPGDEKEFIPLPEERARAKDSSQVCEGSPTS